MRRALKGPCLLFEDFGDEEIASAVAADLRGAQWARALGTVCVCRYLVGETGRAARVDYVRSDQWRAVGASRQPVVHWLAERDLPWPVEARIAVVYTTDVEALARTAEEGRRPGVPGREDLPEGWCWPVVGHPGRLLVLVDDPDGIAGALRELAGQWGPPAQPASIHPLGVVRDSTGGR